MYMAKKKMEECCSPEMAQHWMYKKVKKEVMLGGWLTVVGGLWWANTLGMISLEPFWPIITTATGILVILKAFWMKKKYASM
jgi:hypothetical protein